MINGFPIIRVGLPQEEDRPQGGSVLLYVDPEDNSLRYMDSEGNITILFTP